MASRTQMTASATTATATTAWRSTRPRSLISVSGSLRHRGLRLTARPRPPRSAEATGRGRDEAQDGVDHGRWLLFAQAFDGARRRQTRAIEDSVRAAHGAPIFCRHAGAAHADDVDAAHLGFADHEHVGRDVLGDSREAADHRQLADAY